MHGLRFIVIVVAAMSLPSTYALPQRKGSSPSYLHNFPHWLVQRIKHNILYGGQALRTAWDIETNAPTRDQNVDKYIEMMDSEHRRDLRDKLTEEALHKDNFQHTTGIICRINRMIPLEGPVYTFLDEKKKDEIARYCNTQPIDTLVGSFSVRQRQMWRDSYIADFSRLAPEIHREIIECIAVKLVPPQGPVPDLVDPMIRAKLAQQCEEPLQ